MQQSHRPQSNKRQTGNAGSSAGPSPIKVTKLNADARPLTADEYRMYGSLVNKLRHGKQSVWCKNVLIYCLLIDRLLSNRWCNGV